MSQYKRVPGGEKTSKTGTLWSKEELQEVLDLYIKLDGKGLHEHNPEIQSLAARLGRSVRSTEAQTLMFRNLERGGEYSHGNMNRHCRELWEEYQQAKPKQESGKMTEKSVDVVAYFRAFLPGGSFTRGRVPNFYVDTGLDLNLKPRLLATRSGYLAVLSGNAGDGKTAFIEGLLHELEQPVVPGQNIYEFDHDGMHFLFILDGSEDTNDFSNDKLLEMALKPFAEGPGEGSPVTVIAVNKGTILSYLKRNQSNYPWLWEVARASFIRMKPAWGDGHVFLDLNDRSLFAGDNGESIFSKMLLAILDNPKWEHCKSCKNQHKCIVGWNLEKLKEKHVQERFIELLKCVDLDDRLHFTARHAVTLLIGTILSGERSCNRIKQASTNSCDGMPFYDFIYSGELFPPNTEVSSTLR